MTSRYRPHRRAQPLGLNMPVSGWVSVGLAGVIAVAKFCLWVLS